VFNALQSNSILATPEYKTYVVKVSNAGANVKQVVNVEFDDRYTARRCGETRICNAISEFSSSLHRLRQDCSQKLVVQQDWLSLRRLFSSF
jgi:hypothetical protein